jgi:putative membrane protein insertion efficiency factor
VTHRRQRLVIVVSVTALLLTTLAWDLTRPAPEQWSARVLLVAIDLYQATLSPVAARVGVRCRFEPTCSHYAEAVIRRHGALSGSARASWRILRCGPWTPAGTSDYP